MRTHILCVQPYTLEEIRTALPRICSCLLSFEFEKARNNNEGLQTSRHPGMLTFMCDTCLTYMCDMPDLQGEDQFEPQVVADYGFISTSEVYYL